MHILVTGATGLVGRNLVKRLIEADNEITVISRKPLFLQSSKVTELLINFEKSNDFSRIPSGVDAVVHLAQSQSFRDFPRQAQEIFATNLRSTAGLLDWAYRNSVKHFVYASSGGLYANSRRHLEGTTGLKPPGVLDFYLSTKLSSEALAQCYANFYSVAVLRFFFIYGPGQNRGMLLPRIYDRVASEEEILLDGSDGFQFNPIHVSDAVEAIVSSLDTPRSLVSNVAGPEVLSLRAASEIMGSHIGKSPRFHYSGGPAIDVVGDTSFMFETLHKSTMTLAEAVNDLAPSILVTD